MRVFLDLDGVLADFDQGYFDRFGVRPSIMSDNVDWNMVRATPGFYRDLPLMHDALDLVAAVQGLGFIPTILTGIPSSVTDAAANKRAWVDRHLGPAFPMIGCLSAEKYLHGAAGDVLIDDWEKYRDRWVGMGGNWITHTSAVRSIAALHMLVGR